MHECPSKGVPWRPATPGCRMRQSNIVRWRGKQSHPQWSQRCSLIYVARSTNGNQLLLCIGV